MPPESPHPNMARCEWPSSTALRASALQLMLKHFLAAYCRTRLQSGAPCPHLDSDVPSAMHSPAPPPQVTARLGAILAPFHLALLTGRVSSHRRDMRIPHSAYPTGRR